MVSFFFSDTSVEAVSLRADTGKNNGNGLSLEIMLTPIPRPHTTPTATPTDYHSTPTTNQTTYPLTSKGGPYAIKYTGQRQVLFNSPGALKQVELSVQVNISAIKHTCSPFLNTSYTGWLAWLHGGTLTS